MDKVAVHYHTGTDTMDIWFADPKDEFSCEEAGEGIIFKKNKDGKIIGIEKLYVSKTVGIDQPLPFELIVA
ncbi:MAG: DUF2283 domain-containing protein [Deltaproteobacteria bacterium]|nr:DUF2283 domain-containing protein [Deltaproteobacteria bacterium]